MSDDTNDEPPIKIKKKNEEPEPECNTIKEEIVEVNDTEDPISTSLLNHRVRVLPSWLQLPNTSQLKIENHSNGPSGSKSMSCDGDIIMPQPIKIENECSGNNVSTGQIQSKAIICSDINMLKPIKIKTEVEENTENANEQRTPSDLNPVCSGDIGIPNPKLVKTETQSDENGKNQCTSNSDSLDSKVPSSSGVSLTNGDSKPPCRFGSSCYRLNAEHRRDFYHPPGSDPSKSPTKPRCRYGSQCYRKNEEHRNRFVHPRSPNNFLTNQQRLRNVGSQTYHFSDDDSDGLEDFYTDGSEDEFHVSAEEDESDTDFEAEEDGSETDFNPED